MSEYNMLFSPLRINGMMLKNRIIASPMGIISIHKMNSTTNYGGMSAYDRSLGGAALVHISNLGPGTGEHDLAFTKYELDCTRENWTVAKQAGAKVSYEYPFFSENNSDGTVWGPSAGIRFDGVPMKEMTEEVMHSIAKRAANSCLECKKFGMDAVTLHFGHDSLCSQFLSPVWNQREDEYGGPIENRIRFPKMVLEEIRKAVGPDFPLILRVSRQLIIKETYSEDDMFFFLKSVENIVDMANISCGMDVYHEANVHSAPTIFEPHDYNKNFAKRVKDNTTLKVALVGAVMGPDDSEELLQDGYCDAVMCGRSLIADPYWPKKAQEGHTEDIIPCIRCMNCYHIATQHWNVQCSVNPRFRRENRVPIKLPKTDKPKKVVIIGGGVAGIRTALAADEKGHHVIILEKKNRLLGVLEEAAKGPYKSDLRRYKNYLLAQIQKSNVDVRLGVTATRENVSELKPDYLIIAIGALPALPEIKNVQKGINSIDAIDHIEEIGKKVVIIGGGSIGCELALELTDNGHEVTIVEYTDKIAGNGNMLYQIALNQHLKKATELDILTSTSCEEIKNHSVIVKNEDGEKEIDADSVILATGFKPKKEEAFSFYGITPNTAMVGDCERVATVLEATNLGYFLGANIE